MIQASAVWHTEPEILAAWGSFGAIFTAIAVAHTLYAPREVILWNWRRIVLLGVSLAIAVGSQFSMIIVVPLALAFLLYLAPIRRAAAFIIWAAACIVALTLLFATYFFHPHTFVKAMQHASFWGATWRSFTVRGVYIRSRPRNPARLSRPGTAPPSSDHNLYPLAAAPATSATPLPALIALLFIGLGMAHPRQSPAQDSYLASIPFILIFVSGILADLMETSAPLLGHRLRLGIRSSQYPLDLQAYPKSRADNFVTAAVVPL